MLFSPQCHSTCCIWRSLKRNIFNIFISFDDGMFGSCLVSHSAQFFPHCHQWLGKNCNTSKHKKLFWSAIIMESEADDSHHKSSQQRKYVEASHKLSFTQDLQEKATENAKKIHLPPSLQCRGISEEEVVNITTPMPLQEPDKKSIEDKSSVKQLPPSLRYKSRPENDFEINKSPVPLQGRVDICDSKHSDFCSSSNSPCSPERECKDSSKQQPLHDLKENMAGRTKPQLPPSLLNFVEKFVRDNIKVVTDQVKKESHEDAQKKDLSEGSPANEFEDTETPFSNMNLFSSSELTEGSAVVQKKKPRKWSKQLSKKKVLIALAVAILAFIISSLSRSECYKEEMVAKSRKEKGSLNVHSESDGTPDGKGKKKRPNYFIAVQVNNTEITRATMKIQSGIQEASGQDLSQLKIAPETLHITLMVMHLSCQEEIDRASQCLARCMPTIKKIHRDLPRTLEFEGLSGFSGGRVIFARIKDPGEEMLHVMSDEVKKQMKDCGIEDSDPENKPFRPHLTLMKYSWKSKSKGPKKIEDSWYQAFASEYLGSQRINSLQLCKMQEKRDDGYYFVDREVPF